jgi:transcriptional regulator of acetoin/glycerol metabolism
VSQNSLGETTIPAHSAGGVAPLEEGWALRWVFPDPTGILTRLAVPRLVLGRGDDCGARLPGGGTSRQHAEIAQRGALFSIRDLGSTNGTFVNGARIEQSFLALGDVVRLGDWIAIVVRAPLAEPGGTAFGELAPGVLGGPVFRPVLETVRRAARSTLPIIVEGETGTGKEVLARTVHHESGRAGAFVAVNCAALPASLAEGELFGYRKGAFTGADRANLGMFRAADGGTLLLDEIVDMPLALQAKVLRVLEQQEVMPLGESRAVPIDLRVVAAAQYPLQQAVAERRFRGDLLARLNGVTVRIPSLRERKEEIPFLFQRLLQSHSQGSPPEVEPGLIEQRCLYDWPFNVRELDLAARRLLALHGSERSLRRSHLPAELLAARGTPGSGAPPPQALEPPVAQLTDRRSEPHLQNENARSALLDALRANGGNVARAAAAVGITRQRAYRLMEAETDVKLEDLRSKT